MQLPPLSWAQGPDGNKETSMTPLSKVAHQNSHPLDLGFKHPYSYLSKVPRPRNRRGGALLNRRAGNAEPGGTCPRGWTVGK